MNLIECFKIRLLELSVEESLITFGEKSKEILTIPFDKDGKSNPIIIVADPFLFVYRDELYLFYEEKRLYSPGILRMMRTKDLKDWTDPVTVLQESFHLSYPFVFKTDGHVYMIPETCNAEEVRLYQADNDELTHFSQTGVLLGHFQKNEQITINYSDSSVLKKAGMFYLMTTLEIDNKNQLLLYISDNLQGPYKEHPSSPVCMSKKYGRNAGSLIQYDGKLYRVAQDCENRYGDNVHLFEIEEMTESNYEEHVVKEKLLNTSIPFYKEGGHQLNMVRFNNKTIIATDAKEYHSFLVTRTINKMKNLI